MHAWPRVVWASVSVGAVRPGVVRAVLARGVAVPPTVVLALLLLRVALWVLRAFPSLHLRRRLVQRSSHLLLGRTLRRLAGARGAATL